MRSRLGSLEGRIVAAASEVEDYMQVRFQDGTWLNIFNPVSLSGAACADVKALVDRRLTTATESAESVTLRFDDGSVMVVDMRDEAYRCPEALELSVPGEAIVVWR